MNVVRLQTLRVLHFLGRNRRSNHLLEPILNDYTSISFSSQSLLGLYRLTTWKTTAIKRRVRQSCGLLTTNFKSTLFSLRESITKEKRTMHPLTNLFPALMLAACLTGCKKNSVSPDAEAPTNTPLAAAPAQTSDSENSEGNTAAAQLEESSSIETAPPKEETPTKEEDVFSVKLDTTKGDIIIDVHRNWAPLGADRFLELVRSGYYNDVAFFRVIKNFMAQAGISGIPKLNNQWATNPIRDDKVEKSNLRGMVSFAMAGANTRTTQFFINLKDNTSLDGMGFAPIGQVRDMTVVDALYSEYGDGPPTGKGPNQNQLRQQGKKLLKKFPDIDYIKTATIIKE
jgi:peptidyl-prolyl cis-trans isomerase A (cyclophilin A)